MNDDQRVAFHSECQSLASPHKNQTPCLAASARLFNCLASSRRSSCGLDPTDNDHPCHAEATAASMQCPGQTDTVMHSILDEPALLSKLNDVIGGPHLRGRVKGDGAGVDATGAAGAPASASVPALDRLHTSLVDDTTCAAAGEQVDDPYDCCSYTARVQVFPNGSRKQICMAGSKVTSATTPPKSPQRSALDAQFAKNAIREKCMEDIAKLDQAQREEETEANRLITNASAPPSAAPVRISAGAPISVCTSVGCTSDNTQCEVNADGGISCTGAFDTSKGFMFAKRTNGYAMMYGDRYCRLNATREVVCDTSFANAETFHVTSSSPSTLAMSIFDKENSVTRFCTVKLNRLNCNSMHDKSDFGYRIF